MSECGFLLSLMTADNDYQQEQAAAAKAVASRLGVELEVSFAGGDPIKQTFLLMAAVSSGRYEGILFEPIGVAPANVAEMAVKAGCGWVVLNREPEYVVTLRAAARAPLFSVCTDQVEVGRIQGRQAKALLPRGGSALFIQGAVGSDAASKRASGLMEAKPSSLQLRLLRGSWTEESAYQAAKAWLRLNRTRVDAIIAQNDAMAMGARKAVSETATDAEREVWSRVPILGADGLANGQRCVREGLLSATVQIPAQAGEALETLVRGLRDGTMPPAVHRAVPRSLPAVEQLRPVS
jgi:ABC-type sugar transport system substrate-binding protein